MKPKLKSRHFAAFIGFGLLFSATHCLGQAANATDAQGRKQGLWEKKDAEGHKIFTGTFRDGAAQGRFIYYYEDGATKAILDFGEDGKSARAVNFHPNGKKMAEGSYVATRKDGLWKYFTEDEKLASTENYDHGVPEGEWRKYYDTGKLLESCTYHKGVKEGEDKQFFSDGALKAQFSFVGGQYEGPARFNHSNGNPMLEGVFHQDFKEGLWKAFKPDGTAESEITYHKGEVVHEVYFDKQREKELNGELPAIEE